MHSLIIVGVWNFDFLDEVKLFPLFSSQRNLPKFQHLFQRQFPLVKQVLLWHHKNVEKWVWNGISEWNFHLTLTLQRIPLCTAVNLDSQDRDGGSIQADSLEREEDTLSAWVPKNVIWRGRKDLRVKFLNEIPDGWTYAGKDLNTGNIMSWANVWSLQGEGIIPSFTEVKDANAPSDIRVVFNCKLTVVSYLCSLIPRLQLYLKQRRTQGQGCYPLVTIISSMITWLHYSFEQQIAGGSLRLERELRRLNMANPQCGSTFTLIQ